MTQTAARMMVAAAAVALAASTMTGCSIYQKATGMSDDPSSQPPAAPTDQQTIELIDGLRPKGSFEDARDNLTAIARSIAEKVDRAVPGGARWTFNTTSNYARSTRDGLSCTDNPLSADVARKPLADPGEWDPPLTSEGFKIAAGVIRDEAAKLGATQGSSLFDDSAKSEYTVTGNGYEFQLLQMKSALLTVSADCHLLQTVIDKPPGRLPAR